MRYWDSLRKTIDNMIRYCKKQTPRASAQQTRFEMNKFGWLGNGCAAALVCDFWAFTNYKQIDTWCGLETGTSWNAYKFPQKVLNRLLKVQFDKAQANRQPGQPTALAVPTSLQPIETRNVTAPNKIKAPRSWEIWLNALSGIFFCLGVSR